MDDTQLAERVQGAKTPGAKTTPTHFIGAGRQKRGQKQNIGTIPKKRTMSAAARKRIAAYNEQDEPRLKKQKKSA
jgi:hypothetical protein